MNKGRMERFLRVWQNQLGLSHWRITLEFGEAAQENAHASTWRSDNYDKARIRLAPEWPEWSEQEAQEHIVHELLHLQTRDVEQVFNRLDGQLHRDTFDQVDKMFDHEMEGLIDRLSVRLVELAP